MHTRWVALIWLAVASAVWAQGASGAPGRVSPKAEDLLPDMIVDPSFLEDTVLVNNVEPGRLHLLLSNATANVGLGPLYVVGVLPGNLDGSQDVLQRVFRSDGRSYDRPAGRFVFHPLHDHVHLEGWAVYRLRIVLPNGGVGDVIAEGAKTSYCLRDSQTYDSSLPNYPDAPGFIECEGTVQGVSVGYEDLYTRDLPDQWIDVTDVPAGEYWLESEVDPDNHMLESDKTNNVARVRVTIGEPQGPLAYVLDLIRFYIQQLIDWFMSFFGLGGDSKAACQCDLSM